MCSQDALLRTYRLSWPHTDRTVIARHSANSDDAIRECAILRLMATRTECSARFPKYAGLLKITDAKDFKFICYMEEPPAELQPLASRPLDRSTALPLLRATLEALQCAASVGISHRALTPASVLVGPGNRVVLNDWSAGLDPRLPTAPADPNFKGDLHAVAAMWDDRGEYPHAWILNAMSRMPSHMHTSSTIEALLHHLDRPPHAVHPEPVLPSIADAHCVAQLLREESTQEAPQVHPRLRAHFAAPLTAQPSAAPVDSAAGW